MGQINSFWHIPNIKIGGSWGRYIFNIIRSYQAYLQNGSAVMQFSTSSFPAILMNM